MGSPNAMRVKTALFREPIVVPEGNSDLGFQVFRCRHTD